MIDRQNITTLKKYILEKAAELGPTFAESGRLGADLCGLKDHEGVYVRIVYATEYHLQQDFDPEWKAFEDALDEPAPSVPFPTIFLQSRRFACPLGELYIAGRVQVAYKLNDAALPEFLREHNRQVIDKGLELLIDNASVLSPGLLCQLIKQLNAERLIVDKEQCERFEDEVDSFYHHALIHFAGSSIPRYNSKEFIPTEPTRPARRGKNRGRPLGSTNKPKTTADT